MSSIEILEKLGIMINSYFENIIPQNEKYNLCVDEFLFETFLERLELEFNIPQASVYYSLKERRCDCNKNPYVAIAIAAYQVVVFYTLDANTTSDAYNEKLFSSKAYKKLTYQDYWYNGSNNAPKNNEALQEELWALIKMKFRINSIPNNLCFGDRDRYVQYPKSQNLLGCSMRTFRIKFANIFREKGLEPNQGITYELFEKLVFYNNPENLNEMLRKLIFAFYCSWDGRSYEEIENKRKISIEQREQNAKDEFLIKLQPEIQLFINRELINLEEKRIDDKYLWRFDVDTFLSRRGKIFIQDIDYKDWIPKDRNTIDEDDEILLITEQTYFPKYIDEFINNDQIEVFSIGKYKFLLLTDFSREDFEKLRIPLKPISCFSLVGGLKIKRNTYYDFALPVIKLNDTLENKNYYKSVYIDTKEYPIKDGIATITDELKSGRHCVKLLKSWDSSEVYFNVEKVLDADFSDNHGWFLNYSQNTVIPFCEDYEKTIDGLKCIAKMNWIEQNNTKNIDKSLRLFQQQNENLLNRYCEVGNKILNRRQNYGI